MGDNLSAINELLDDLIDHWSVWDQNEQFYLETLAPSLVTDPSKGTEQEQKVLRRLGEELGPDALHNLPSLIRERRTARFNAAEQKRKAELQRAARAAELQLLRKKQRKLREEAFADIRASLVSDFLGTEALWKSLYTEVVTRVELTSWKADFVKEWFRQYSDMDQPDKEQAAAIAETGSNVQVIARAGSGKTRTLLSRAFFLQKHCRVAPNEMLLLAFNRKAAEEMADRLRKFIQGDVPQAMTFHALAYALVHPDERLLYDADENPALSQAVQSIIDDLLRISEWKDKIRGLMLAHFRDDWEQIIKGGYHLSQQEFLRYHRSLPRQALRGEHLKSWGEKLIADFLFEHSVPYLYERNWRWGRINYRPDFTVYRDKNSGVVIEYFGRSGDPDYDTESQRKREYWMNRPGWSLIELTPEDRPQDAAFFRERLRSALEMQGFTLTQMSEDELWNQIKDRAVDRFSSAMRSFILRCRQVLWDAPALSDAIRRHKPLNGVEAGFLRIADHLYPIYLERLVATKQDDFCGLMLRSIEAVNRGATRWARRSGQGDFRKLRYLLIDEHQDFSKLFHSLVSAIKAQNGGIELFCVGDDWQAINRFAGSDLSYFTDFLQEQAPARQVHLPTNYRSAGRIVKAGNAVMDGLGEPALPRTGAGEGEVLVADLDRLLPTAWESETHPGDSLTPAVLRLVAKAAEAKKSVALLARRDGLPWYVYEKDGRGSPLTLDRYLAHIRSYLPKELVDQVYVSTVHSFKGREEEWVVVLDAVPRSYPLLHPDWIFGRVFRDDLEELLAEERRLFHVAVTRAMDVLVLVTETAGHSPLLDTVIASKVTTFVDWSKLPPPVLKVSRILVKIGNQQGRGSSPTFHLTDLLQADGFRFVTAGWVCWAKGYQEATFRLEQLKEAPWAEKADGLEVRVCDYKDIALATYRVDGGIWHLD